MFSTLRSVITEELEGLGVVEVKQLVEQRREKFYAMGVWTE
jgi:acetyl-CoA carboxylase alpha subunit